MKKTLILSGVAAAAATAVIFGLAPAPAPASPGVPAATTYSVDAVHSSLVFKIRHMDVAPFYGRFNGVDGEFAVDAEDLTSGRINITVNASTVDTNSDRRDDHLRSADFFNVKQFPEITFTSTSIEQGEGDTLRVTGDFTLHGVTKSITIDVEQSERDLGQRGKRAGLATEFTINRSEYDMTYGIDEGSLADEVTLFIAIEGVAK